MEVDKGNDSDLNLNLAELPPEILIHICSFLEAGFVIKVLAKVCERFRRLVDDPILWRLRISGRWPHKYPPVDLHPDQEEQQRWDSLKWSDACSKREDFTRDWSRHDSTKDHFKIRGHYSSVDTILLMGPESSLVVTGSRDRSIALWNMNNMEGSGADLATSNGLVQKRTDVHKGWVWSLSRDPVNPNSLVSCGWDNLAHKWTVTESDMTLERSVNCKTALLCSDIHPDSSLVIVGTFDKKVKWFDLRSPTASVVAMKHHKMPVLDVCALPGTQHQMISASEDGTLAKVDLRAKKVVNRLAFKDSGYPMCMGLMEDTNALFVGDKTGGLRIVDAYTMAEVKSVKGLHKEKVTGIDVSKGGIVTCSTDKTVKLLQPDLGLAVVASIEDKDFGDVTAVSHVGDSLAIGRSLEMFEVWKPKATTTAEDV